MLPGERFTVLFLRGLPRAKPRIGRFLRIQLHRPLARRNVEQFAQNAMLLQCRNLRPRLRLQLMHGSSSNRPLAVRTGTHDPPHKQARKERIVRDNEIADAEQAVFPIHSETTARQVSNGLDRINPTTQIPLLNLRANPIRALRVVPEHKMPRHGDSQSVAFSAIHALAVPQVEALLRRRLYRRFAAQRSNQIQHIVAQLRRNSRINNSARRIHFPVGIQQPAKKLRTLLKGPEEVFGRNALLVRTLSRKPDRTEVGKNTVQSQLPMVLMLDRPNLALRHVQDMFASLHRRNVQLRCVVQTTVPDRHADNVRMNRKFLVLALIALKARNLPLPSHRLPVLALHPLTQNVNRLHRAPRGQALAPLLTPANRPQVPRRNNHTGPVVKRHPIARRNPVKWNRNNLRRQTIGANDIIANAQFFYNLVSKGSRDSFINTDRFSDAVPRRRGEH